MPMRQITRSLLRRSEYWKVYSLNMQFHGQDTQRRRDSAAQNKVVLRSLYARNLFYLHACVQSCSLWKGLAYMMAILDVRECRSLSAPKASRAVHMARSVRGFAFHARRFSFGLFNALKGADRGDYGRCTRPAARSPPKVSCTAILTS